MFSGAPLQGRGDAGTEQIDKLENGMAEHSLAWSLLVGGRVAAMAPEDLLREEEDHMNLHVFETQSYYLLPILSYNNQCGAVH